MAKKLTRRDTQVKRAGPGRPKGSPNKSTQALKDAILMAVECAGNELRPGSGLVGYLQHQATENPVAMLNLIGKVLPMQVVASIKTTAVVSDKVLTPDEWAAQWAVHMSDDESVIEHVN
tara:strand:+ start:215 stop:571 length:357 start_codon:yes stop_codon:yes gene_type:complete